MLLARALYGFGLPVQVNQPAPVGLGWPGSIFFLPTLGLIILVGLGSDCCRGVGLGMGCLNKYGVLLKTICI